MTDTALTLKESLTHTWPGNGKIDLDKAIELRLKGLTYTDIGKQFKCSASGVYQAISTMLPANVDISIFKKYRSDILAGKQAQALKYLTPDKLEKAPPGTLSLIFSQLYDKERLERDKSTVNLATYNETKAHMDNLEKLKEERKKLELST